MKDKDIHSKLILMICKRGITVSKIFLKREITFLKQVNWDKEKECFHTFCKETSEFYCFKPSMFQDLQSETEGSKVF